MLAILLCAFPVRAAPAFPQLTGRVVDAAGILPPESEARLDRKLGALEAQSRRQLVIVTLASLQGYEISDYGYQLGRAWGIGGKERNDGALLIVAPAERKVRIEVGYGLEGVLTDGLSSLIVGQAIVPRFKAGDMPGGIEAGADAIIRQLTLPPDEARQIAAQAQAQAASSQSAGFDPGLVVFGLVFLVFFILPLFRRRGGRRYRGGIAPVVLWPGGFGGSSGGGGGFGGGFSGGGGSFGGGGASGSW